MSTLSTTPRTHTITLSSASAGPFQVPYRLFDRDDVFVYVDGERTVDWTLSATFNDGISDNAAVTFSSEQSAGSVIIIDSALQPIRAQDMLNGSGLVDFWNNEAGRIWSALADLRRDARRAVRSFIETEPANFPADAVVKSTGSGFAPGPTTTQISNAETRAQEASASALAATSAAQSLLINTPDWQTATSYALAEIVVGQGDGYAGNFYVCTTAHTSDVFADDVSDGKWQAFPRVTPGFVIGEDVQAYDENLPTWPASVSATEVGYLNGLTGAIQGQIDGIPAVINEADMASNSTTRPASQASVRSYVKTFASGGEATTDTTSGTVREFTNLPQDVTSVTILLDGVSLGPDNALLQFSSGGSFVETGYVSTRHSLVNSGLSSGSSTVGVEIGITGSNNVLYGEIRLEKWPGSNRWFATTILRRVNTSSTIVTGSIELPGVLDGIRLATTGSNTFDAGSMAIKWKRRAP